MELIHQFRSKYAYNDPLADLRLPYIDKYIVNYVNGDEFKRQEITEVLFAMIVYHGLYLYFGFILSLFPEIMKKLKTRKNIIDFSIRCVSFIQSIVICLLTIPLINNPYLNEDHIFATVPFGYLFCRLATGYFIWDCFISILHINLFGIGFLVHAISSVIVCYIGATGYIHYYAPLFLFFEVSTPFLNIRWFGLKFPDSIGDTVQLSNNIILILIFFFVRICWGWLQIYNLTKDFINVKDDPRFNLTYSVIICSLNFVLDILNLYWFNKMMIVAINTLKKMFSSDKEVDDEKLKLM